MVAGAPPQEIIVGIDYGTTYSGVSWVLSRAGGVDDVDVLDKWGSSSSSYSYQKQVPSRMAYGPDAWGYDTKGHSKVFVWSKLLLDTHVKAADFDDGGLSYRHIYGPGFMTTPPDKSAEQVVTDYLRCLYNSTMAQLERRLTESFVKSHRIKFWFTMPAIWSIKAESATRNAAAMAGFGSRRGDELHMIREPEAAAIAVLGDFIAKGPDPRVKVGDGVLICDCGGGTVDLASYEIVKAYPKIHLKQACISEGGKCGSTTIDRAFIALMQSRFGANFTNLAQDKRGPASRFMDEFETAKRDFGASKLETRLRLNLNPRHDQFSPHHYDDEEREVVLSPTDMQGLFDPVVGKVIRLLEQQIAATQSQSTVTVDTIILVGGFGESPYLYSKLKEWCPSSISLICPKISWYAICVGAAVRGLEGPIAIQKKSKRHLGHRIGRAFREGIDKESDAYLDRFSGQKMVNGYMQWKIARGEDINPETIKSEGLSWVWESTMLKVFELELYESLMSVAPEKHNHESVTRVGAVRADLTTYDFDLFEKTHRGGEWVYKVKFDLVIIVEDDMGYMHFRVDVDGKTVGTASLKFGDEDTG